MPLLAMLRLTRTPAPDRFGSTTGSVELLKALMEGHHEASAVAERLLDRMEGLA